MTPIRFTPNTLINTYIPQHPKWLLFLMRFLKDNGIYYDFVKKICQVEDKDNFRLELENTIYWCLELYNTPPNHLYRDLDYSFNQMLKELGDYFYLKEISGQNIIDKSIVELYKKYYGDATTKTDKE